MTTTIFGRELKVGQLIKSWVPGEVQRVLEIGDQRTQVLNGKTHRLATAYCTNGYNVTIFLDKKNVRLA